MHTEDPEQGVKANSEKGVGEDDNSDQKPSLNDLSENVSENEEPTLKEAKTHRIQIWSEIRPSLLAIENMMSIRVKKKSNLSKVEQGMGSGKPLLPIEESRSPRGASEEDSEDEFYDVERSDPSQDGSSSENLSASAVGVTSDGVPAESLFPWKEELEVLVRGGVPMALRGEVHITSLSFLHNVVFID